MQLQLRRSSALLIAATAAEQERKALILHSRSKYNKVVCVEPLREIVSCHQETALDWSLNSLADQGFANFTANHSTDGL